MTERRALLTDREREIVAGDADVEDSYRYQTISRIRARFGRIEEDLEALEKHGDLADELREIVCRAEAGQERREAPAEGPSGERPADPAPVGEERDTPPEAAESDAVGDALEDADFPAGREREACSAAVYAAREYLREHGPATKRDLVAEVMPDHPLGYDVDGALEKVEAGDRYRGAWWRRVVKPGLKALPDVEAPARGASEWRYTDEI